MLTCSHAFAVKAPLSKEQLEEVATHIVIGTVRAIYSRIEREGNYEYTMFIAEVKIEKLEKGEEPDDLIYVRYFSIDWKGGSRIPPGPSGHSPLPRKGSIHRFYLARNAYDGFTSKGTRDGGYNIIYANGVQSAKE